jgi:enoyl-CoA hydratase
MSGKTIGALEAEKIGLVSCVVDEGEPRQIGETFCRQFTGYSKIALMLAKQAVQRAFDSPLEAGLRIEADLSTLAYQTNDADEGMHAFIEKRKPVFKDW